MKANEENTVQWNNKGNNGDKEELMDMLDFAISIIENLPEELCADIEVDFKSGKIEKVTDTPLCNIGNTLRRRLNEIKEQDNG